jgi:hypothetical protein
MLLALKKNPFFVDFNNIKSGARLSWLIPIILATWEAEIRRMRFKASPGK